MPACLAIYDTSLGLWLVGWDSHNQTGIFGNAQNAICFATNEQRQQVLDILNQGQQGSRFIGQNPPPR